MVSCRLNLLVPIEDKLTWSTWDPQTQKCYINCSSPPSALDSPLSLTLKWVSWEFVSITAGLKPKVRPFKHRWQTLIISFPELDLFNMTQLFLKVSVPSSRPALMFPVWKQMRKMQINQNHWADEESTWEKQSVFLKGETRLQMCIWPGCARLRKDPRLGETAIL